MLGAPGPHKRATSAVSYGSGVSVRHWTLTAGQYYRDSGITRQTQATKTWLATVKPQLTALSRVSSKPSSLASYRRFVDTVLATYDAMWAEVSKKRWANAKFRLYCGEMRVVASFWAKVRPNNPTPRARQQPTTVSSPGQLLLLLPLLLLLYLTLHMCANASCYMWLQVNKQAKKLWPDRILALAYGAAGFNGTGTIGCRGVPVSQMRKEAVKQFRPERVVLVDEFRTSRVSSADNTPSETLLDTPPESFRWLRPVKNMAKRSQVRGLMCLTSINNITRAPITGTAPAANNTPSLSAAAPVFADVEKITGLQPAQALDLLRSVLSSLNSIASAQSQTAPVPPATAAGVGPLSYAGALTAAPILPEVGTSAAAAAADEIQRLRQQLVGVTAHLEAAQNEAVRVRAELSEMESLQDRQNVVMNRLRTPPGLAGGPPPPAHRGPYWDVSSSSSSGGHRGSRHSSQGGGRHAGRAAQAPPATAPVCPAPAAGGSTLPIPGYACHHCWNPNHFRDYCNLKHLPADEARRVSGYPRPASLGPPSRHANPPGDLPPRPHKRDRSPPGKGGWKQQGSRGDRRR
ncbi:hypothetical protein QJQ45_001466 [Haematococcus lacustris]|nr:hypothetical protein QJQ45_001466 [Haematococcus lacustris]